MKVFYTSDNHFGHKNIIKYCNRPFVGMDDMAEGMIARWNGVVGPEDVIYHLGDFCFLPFEKAKAIVARLNGQKIIVKGNHDRGPERLKEMGFQAACHSMEREDGGRRWLLIHNPADAAGAAIKNVLCGHVHTSWSREKDYMGNGIDAINVGVDVRGFTPRTIEELLSETNQTPSSVVARGIYVQEK